MLDGETVSYPVSSGVFLISKTIEEVSENKPYVDENANRTNQTGGISYPVNNMKGQIN